MPHHMHRLNCLHRPRCLCIVLMVALLLAAWPAPVQAQLKPAWYKGNLHTHSLWSDGNDFPEVICDWYKQHGYQFVALSDHNVLAEGIKWMPLREVKRRGGAEALPLYQKRFGDDWVETRHTGDDTEVRLKQFYEYRALLEEAGRFILLQGEEITDHFGKLPVHMNATNLHELIKPRGGDSVRAVIENNLKAVLEQSARLHRPILPHVNHPNFGWAVTAEDLAHVVQERFFEVYNGHPSVRQRGDAYHPSVERLWDIANTIRVGELKAPPMFALATDDAHNYFGVKGASPGRGWIMVRARRLTPNSILDAVTTGDFYASSGVSLRDVQYDADTRTIRIVIEPDGDATYTTRFIGTLKGYDRKHEPVTDDTGQPLPVTQKYSADVGKVLATAQGLHPTYTLTGDELYVRATITSSKAPANPVWPGQKRQAWTQPVGWK